MRSEKPITALHPVSQTFSQRCVGGGGGGGGGAVALCRPYKEDGRLSSATHSSGAV